MTIGELSRAADVPISTLRFYERRGLVRPTSRSRAGYRSFVDADVARVRFLRRAQELGFTLEELGMMLTMSERRSVKTDDIGRVGSAKLAEIDGRLADLARVRHALAGLLNARCLDPDEPCPIIAALADRTPLEAARRPTRRAKRRRAP